MKIYTRTGDSGKTSLVGGKRIAKDSVRLEAYGTVDELNSQLGMLVADLADLPCGDPRPLETLRQVQNRLFNLGAYLATDNAAAPETPVAGLGKADVELLETEIDGMTRLLPPLANFILPGGNRASASANICRTVCRRAERRVVALQSSLPPEATLQPIAVEYLNRLSDYLFTLGRYVNHLSGIADVPWQK